MPFQSSIFASVVLTTTLTTNFQDTHKFELINGSLSTTQLWFTTYNFLRLNGSLPSFTTENYAVTPFAPINSLESGTAASSWSRNTTRYSINPTCSAAKINPESGTTYNKSYNFSTADNTCFSDLGVISGFEYDDSARFYGGFVGYLGGYTDFSNYYIDSYTCPPNDARGYRSTVLVFILDNSTYPQREVGAVFCDLSYERDHAQISVDPITQAVVTSSDGTGLEKLSLEEFDPTEFEYMLSNSGLPPSKDYDPRYGKNQTAIPFQIPPRQYAFTPDINQEFGLQWIYAFPFLGYLTAVQPNVTALLDNELLADAMARTLRLLFANYVRTALFQESDTTSAPQSGSRVYTRSAIIVVPLFAHLVTMMLAVTIVVLITFLIVSFRRENNLLQDPGSLGGLAALISGSENMRSIFNGLDEAGEKEINHRLATWKFRLGVWNFGYPYRLDCSEEITPKVEATPKTLVKNDVYQYPFMLKRIYGILFTVSLAGISGFLCYLYYIGRKDNGLPSISPNIQIQQLLFAILPTGIGSLLALLWEGLTRWLCVYLPFERLIARNTDSRGSISDECAIRPPQFVLRRAIDSKANLVIIATLMTLLGQVLTVALSGLFQQGYSPQQENESYRSLYAPKVTNLPFVVTEKALKNDGNILGSVSSQFVIGEKDVSYQLYSHLTYGIPLPPWMNSERFFTPFFATNETSNANKTFISTTQSFFASLDCSQNAPSYNGTSVNYASTIEVNGETISCVASHKLQGDYKGVGFVNLRPEIAAEIYPLFVTEGAQVDVVDDSDPCASIFGFTSIRAVSTADSNNGYGLENIRMNSLICQPNFHIEDVQVAADFQGRILNTTATTGNPTTTFDMAGVFDSSITKTKLAGTLRQLFSKTEVTPHDGLSVGYEDWSTQIIISSSNSTDIINPDLEPPDNETIKSALTGVYQIVFAAFMAKYHPQLLSPTTVENEKIVTGSYIERVPRVFMSKPMFLLSAAILLIYLISAISIYSFHERVNLPRQPTSIVSLMAYFYASDMVLDDVRGTEHMTSKERSKFMERRGYLYGYGRFIGRDGRERSGVEREPLIGVPP
ncbi:hypothetical protein TWF694_006104 [Orbilia ellipsospora]|uniref:Uncharacterized protein n=1 Tax=Orbilia ellipsospora TaxID=2528407 RepID=A0AAV9WTD6_9PEZI